MKSSVEHIGVIGGGSWGTALADVLARNGHDTTLWVYEQDLAAEMTETRINTLYLPGFTLHPSCPRRPT